MDCTLMGQSELCYCRTGKHPIPGGMAAGSKRENKELPNSGSQFLYTLKINLLKKKLFTLL